LVVLSPDRAPARYEVLSVTVQSAMVRTLVTPNVKAQISGLRSAMAQTVETPNVVIPNETAQTSGFRNATVQIVLVQSVGTPNVTVAAHCEASQSVAEVHYVAEAPRCVVVGARRCGELQPWQAARYAEEVHSSESVPRFAAPVEMVQCVRELA
jgi:hypothetical protein